MTQGAAAIRTNTHNLGMRLKVSRHSIIAVRMFHRHHMRFDGIFYVLRIYQPFLHYPGNGVGAGKDPLPFAFYATDKGDL